MSKVLAQRVTQLEAALRTMIELAPQEQPATEEYDDTKSAYNNGVDKLTTAPGIWHSTASPHWLLSQRRPT